MDDAPNMGGDWWNRRTNRYCDCPPSRYSPVSARPTNPECVEHGTGERCE